MSSFKLYFILPLIILTCCAISAASEKVASFNVTVAPKQWKAARVKNLPVGAKIGITVFCEERISVAFLDEKDAALWPKPKKPLMTGSAEGKLSFSVTIPETGHYYVVIVNPSATFPQHVSIVVSAEPPSTDPRQAADNMLQEFESQMHRLFIYEPFTFQTQKCAGKEAFHRSNGVFLCQQYVYQLYHDVEDAQTAKSALLYSIFFEFSEELLKQWEIGDSDLPKEGDALATAILTMLDQTEPVNHLVDQLEADPKIFSSLEKTFGNKLHPLSRQRAAAIRKYFGDTQHLRKWQGILLPKMQTAFLLSIYLKRSDWADLDAVSAELAKRKQNETIPHDTPKVKNNIRI